MIKTIFGAFAQEKWTVLVYRLDDSSGIFSLRDKIPQFVISESGIRKNLNYRTTVADPFIFARPDALYIFYEVQSNFENGEIWASSVDESGGITHYGQVLREDFHLSFPNVFEFENSVYMIPEMGKSNELYLYQCVDFPMKWRKLKKLATGRFFDPSIYIGEDGCYMVATVNGSLYLYYSKKLGEEFERLFEITSDKKICRNAGQITFVDGRLLRFSQKCDMYYGESVSVHEIKKLSKSGYAEIPFCGPIFDRDIWQFQNGYHHVALGEWRGKFYVAVDGRRRDSLLNNIVLLGQRLLVRLGLLRVQGS